MKESKFIEQNKENWLEFEKKLKNKEDKVSRLNNLFIQITDDLSYARTFYKHRSVKIYLNGIAQILFNDLYRNKAGSFKNFINFWKIDLPLHVYEARKELNISFLIFFISFLIGLLSSIYDKDFAKLVLGEDYVNMTLENIANKDPMAVYKKGHETSMFVSIAVNNLYVAAYTFVLGIFFSMGTILSLIRNALMLGGFQYFFIERGLFRESFLTVWQHGTLEISSIIIAGAAGITLGKGLLFPGTYSRLDAFKKSAMRGLKLFTGVIPVFIIAAFIEGFITRHTGIGDHIRILVILFSLLFVLVYFVWYPRYIAKIHTNPETGKDTKYGSDNDGFSFERILTAEEILGLVLKFSKKSLLWLFTVILSIALFHTIITVIREGLTESYFSSTGKISGGTFFTLNHNGFQFIAAIISLTILQCVTVYRISKHIFQNIILNFKKFNVLILNSLIISFAIVLPFSLGLFWGLLSSIALSPLLFLVVFYSFSENCSLFDSVVNLSSMLNLSWKKVFWNSLKISGFTAALYIMLNTGVTYAYIETIYMNFNYSEEIMYLIKMGIITFLSMLLMALFYFMQVSAAIFTSCSLKETVYAENLKKRISELGERNILFGFEKE